MKYCNLAAQVEGLAYEIFVCFGISLFKYSSYFCCASIKHLPGPHLIFMEFRKLRDKCFSHGYSYLGYPEKRKEMGWSVNQFFDLQAAKSRDLDDFLGRTTSVLPPSAHRELFKILSKFEPVYEKLIWIPSKDS